VLFDAGLLEWTHGHPQDATIEELDLQQGPDDDACDEFPREEYTVVYRPEQSLGQDELDLVIIVSRR